MDKGNSAVDGLGRLLASKGVPPFLVAANISESNYKSVRLWKENGCILVEAVCIDEDTIMEHVFLYRYDSDQTLRSIEMRIGSRCDVVWSRDQEIRKAALASQGVPARS